MAKKVIKKTSTCTKHPPRKEIRIGLFFSLRDEDMEPVCRKKSETLPAQSLTVRELLERHTRGLPLPPPSRDIDAYDSEDLDQIFVNVTPDAVENMTIDELAELKQNNDALISEYRAQYRRAVRAAKLAAGGTPAPPPR